MFYNYALYLQHPFPAPGTENVKGDFYIVKWGLRVLPLLYMIFIWVLSSMPANAVVELPSSKWDGWIKESLHLVEFGLLYVLLVLALLTFTSLTPKLNLLCIVIASLYGLLDEVHQSFVPARSATLIDLVKDVIGVLAAAWLLTNAYKKKRFPRFGRVLHGVEKKSKVPLS